MMLQLVHVYLLPSQGRSSAAKAFQSNRYKCLARDATAFVSVCFLSLPNMVDRYTPANRSICMPQPELTTHTPQAGGRSLVGSLCSRKAHRGFHQGSTGTNLGHPSRHAVATGDLGVSSKRVEIHIRLQIAPSAHARAYVESEAGKVQDHGVGILAEVDDQPSSSLCSKPAKPIRFRTGRLLQMGKRS